MKPTGKQLAEIGRLAICANTNLHGLTDVEAIGEASFEASCKIAESSLDDMQEHVADLLDSWLRAVGPSGVCAPSLAATIVTAAKAHLRSLTEPEKDEAVEAVAAILESDSGGLSRKVAQQIVAAVRKADAK